MSGANVMESPKGSGTGFIWDDNEWITENRLVREEGGLARIWTDPRSQQQYHPLVPTTFSRKCPGVASVRPTVLVRPWCHTTNPE